MPHLRALHNSMYASANNNTDFLCDVLGATVRASVPKPRGRTTAMGATAWRGHVVAGNAIIWRPVVIPLVIRVAIVMTISASVTIRHRDLYWWL